jgi:4-hydroxybenzoate polyprenyltransferase
MRLHRPIGILLLLWPTLIALWLASDGSPKPLVVLIFIAGTVVMRSAGCVINDWADRKFDAHVARTSQRPLVTGAVSSGGALVLFGILLAIAFALVLLLNIYTIILSIGAVFLATLYPFMKRYTHFPQVILGAAFAWAIPMAYAAQGKPLALDCWLIFVAAVLWTLAYDTEYAMADIQDDLKIGVKSMAIALGKYDKISIGILAFLSLATWCAVGIYLHLGLFYFCGIIISTIFIGYQLWLIRDRDPQACFNAFINNQWVGLALFFGTFLNNIKPIYF